jgi:hypothetical protein
VSIQSLQQFCCWLGPALAFPTTLPRHNGGRRYLRTRGRGEILGHTRGGVCWRWSENLFNHPLDIGHRFIEQTSVVCRFERGGPPGRRHNHHKHTIPTTSSQFSPLSVVILLPRKRPSLVFTPSRLTSCPPFGPLGAVFADISDVR